MSTYSTILFYNFSDTNFTFTYDKETYTVKAGERESFPEFLALHGAKHLVDRELVRAGKIKQLNDVTVRDEMYAKILGKPTSFKKEEPKEATIGPVSDIEVEEEFPDLKKLNPEPKEAQKPEPIEPTEVTEPKPVDLSRSELFAKVRELGIKVKVPITNEELRRLVSTA